MNITYLLGAGASAKACPILSNQGKKMIELATAFIDPPIDFNLGKPMSLSPIKTILFDIGYFGTKAEQYGTIDTYAKKLYFSNDYEGELDRLKRSVSLFFTIWESMNNDHNIRDGFQKIDQRYLGLLASILEKTTSKEPRLNQNIKFVSWNYDLQLERAYKSFCIDSLGWDHVSNNLKFRINSADLDICHLNGYNGFYSTSKKEVDTVDRGLENMEVQSILKELEFTVESQSRGSINFENQINYAWESNDSAVRVRKVALEVFKKTDILVIIGYSFPPFNKEIDQELFKGLMGRKTKIFYQDPNASEEFISILTAGCDTEIRCFNDKLDHFFLPYSFELP